MTSLDLLDHDWQEINADGTKHSLLEGDREQGAFTYLFFLPAGTWDPPHWHTGDSRIYVLKGTLMLNFSAQFDKSSAFAFREGSLLLVPENVVHYDGAETDTTILGFGMGPWSTSYVTETKRAS